MIMELHIKKFKFKNWLLLACILFCKQVVCHPMPSAIVNLSLHEKYITGEAKVPLIELQNAIGNQIFNAHNNAFFYTYFSNHIAAYYTTKKWATKIDSINLTTDKDSIVGNYNEIVVYFTLTPPNNEQLQSFTFNYDAVIHQVITHKILVYTYQINNVKVQQQIGFNQIGVIQLDIPSGKILPLIVNVENPKWWKKLSSAIKLGSEHIKEGTDHLLFILVLILPSMLIIQQKRWSKFGGTFYSIVRILKIITSFTITHAISVIIGTLGWLKFPAQPVEVLIAFSIIVAAIHAIYPLFFGKEMYVAAGFGLIHGLAFATVLVNFHLSASNIAISIFGFNIGIELMQLLIITLIFPWLILLSKTPIYHIFRVFVAILALIAAFAWMIERLCYNQNFITPLVSKINQYAIWHLILFAMFSIFVHFFYKIKSNT
jgi:HupE / UreJ protein